MFIINILSERPLAEHALLRTIDTGRIDAGILSDFLENSRGLAAVIPTWMEAMIDRAPNSAIRILLAKQLNEELGRCHADLRLGVKRDWLLAAWKAMVDSIEADDQAQAPGQRWLDQSGRCFRDLSFTASAGALVAAKYRSEEMSTWLDITLRRQGGVAVSQYGWLEQHATRQAEHAADIENLLVIIASDHERGEAIRGARAFDARLWGFLDHKLQRQCETVAA